MVKVYRNIFTTKYYENYKQMIIYNIFFYGILIFRLWHLISQKSLRSIGITGSTSFLPLYRYVLFFLLCASYLFCCPDRTPHGGFGYEFQICPETKYTMQFISKLCPFVRRDIATFIAEQCHLHPP